MTRHKNYKSYACKHLKKRNPFIIVAGKQFLEDLQEITERELFNPIDDVAQWWKLNSRTCKQLLSPGEKRMLNIKTRKRK